MPIIPVFLIAAQAAAGNADAVADRFVNYVRSHPSISVKIQLVKTPEGPGSGYLKIKQPFNAVVMITAGKTDYEAHLETPMSMEAYPGKKSYAFFESAPEMGFYNARMYESVYWYGLNNLIEIQEFKKWPWTYKSKQGDVDTIWTDRAAGAQNIAHFEFDIDAEGKLLRQAVTIFKRAGAKTDTLGPGGVMNWDTRFSDYQTSPLDAMAMTMDPQPGWSAESLPSTGDPMLQGWKLPSAQLLDPNGGKVSLADALGSNGVVEVLDPEWTSSKFGAQTLKTVEGKFSAAGIKTVRFFDTAGQTAAGFYSDPSGQALRWLNPPGSPCFFWFTKDGKMKQAWFACSPREPESLFKDIDEALAPEKPKKDVVVHPYKP